MDIKPLEKKMLAYQLLWTLVYFLMCFTSFIFVHNNFNLTLLILHGIFITTAFGALFLNYSFCISVSIPAIVYDIYLLSIHGFRAPAIFSALLIVFIILSTTGQIVEKDEKYEKIRTSKFILYGSVQLLINLLWIIILHNIFT